MLTKYHIENHINFIKFAYYTVLILSLLFVLFPI